MPNKKLSLILAVSILVVSPLGLLVRQPSVLADCPPFVPDALCPSNKPIPGQRLPPVQKGLTICNKTSVDNVYVAIALDYSGPFPSDGFPAPRYTESHGWWKIETGACKKVYENDASRVRGYYAKGGDSVWRGSDSKLSYCINSSEFEFKYQKAYQKENCEQAGGEMVAFRPVRPSRQAYSFNLTN
ncbi:DUF1036 domain-containing protein [Microcoleus sp. EPA2]|uniref:DUF1036 domain-containing protein n=1 Tax=Microcoleus sp. EPA2 TaxID=2841654 RepID=UPI00312B32D6